MGEGEAAKEARGGSNSVLPSKVETLRRRSRRQPPKRGSQRVGEERIAADAEVSVEHARKVGT